MSPQTIAKTSKPGTWIEQAGATLSRGETNEARYTRVFHANPNEGQTEAARRGYVKGATLTVQGIPLIVTTIASRNIGGRDEVTVEYAGAAGIPPPPRARKPHTSGDEEWTGSGALDEVAPEDFIRADGLTDSGLTEYIDGLADGTKLLMPKDELVQRRWIKPPYAVGSVVAPKVLPKNFTQMQALLNSITWAKKGYVLGGSDEQKQWLCTDQSIEADGELICVSSKFTKNPKGWDTNVYPALAS